MRPYLTIFVPAYNEQANLEQTIALLRSKAQDLEISIEILIVDDGSQDRTGQIADQLSSRWEQVKVVHHPVNQGIGAAFLTARDLASGEWFILIPADLALELDDLSKYLHMSGQADIVVGLRSDRRDYTWMRKMISWINIRAIQILFRINLHQFQYISLYRTELLQKIAIEYWQSAFFLPEILIKARALGAIIKEIPVRYVARKSGVATGAKPAQVIRTVVDIFRFWLRWLLIDHSILSMRKSMNNAKRL